MNRPKFHDIDTIGRTAPRPGRGLDALIPTGPDAGMRDMSPAYAAGYDDGAASATSLEQRKYQWGRLEAALFSLTSAQFEYEHEHGQLDRQEAARMHVEDCRRRLGELALSLAAGPDAEGYARLFGAIMTEPKVRR